MSVLQWTRGQQAGLASAVLAARSAAGGLACGMTAVHVQVTYASSLAADGAHTAGSLAYDAVQVPVGAVTKPIRHLAQYFASDDDRSRTNSHGDGHAMQPLLSSLSGQANGDTRGMHEPATP